MVFIIKRKLDSQNKNEKGAVLLLVALLASALIIMAGLAIDTAIVASSKTQQRHAAEYMALGALKAFNEEASTNNRDKLATATRRAQEIARQNEFLAKGFLVSPTQENIGNNVNMPIQDHGTVTPGIWYFDEGSGDCNTAGLPAPCPCKTATPTEWATPCFRALDYNSATDLSETPNAARVVLKTASTSPIKTLFSKVSGNSTISISARTTAVQVPRRGVFLVDLSRSSHNETHLPLSVVGSHSVIGNPHPTWGQLHVTDADEYTFQLDNTAGNPSCLSTPANGNPCFGVLPPNCTFEEGYSTGNGADSAFDLYETIYNLLNFAWIFDGFPVFILEIIRPGPTISRLHYKTDYQCFEIDYQETLADDTPTGPSNRDLDDQRFLIDTYTFEDTDGVPPDNSYDGPEPLTSMLFGINQALSNYEENMLPDDRVSVIGIDSSARIDLRTIESIAIDTTSGSDFEKLKTMTDIDNQTAAHFSERLENHFFFPRLDPHLNMPEALEVARDILIGGGNITSENFVVVLSDGITTCLNDESPTGCDTDTGNPITSRYCRNCSASYNGFMNSFNKAKEIVENDYVPNNLKLHFIQIGQNAQPHSLVLVNDNPAAGESACIEEDQSRLLDPPIQLIDYTTPAALTDDQSFKELAYGNPFYGASRFYELVRMTEGKWLPLRPCCQSAGACNDVRIQLETACDASSGALGDTVPSLTDTASTFQFTDADGRLTCDAMGRSRRQQIADAMDDIFNIDPYILVD